MHRADHAVMLDNESGRILGSKAGWASIGTFEALTVKPRGLFPTGVDPSATEETWTGGSIHPQAAPASRSWSATDRLMSSSTIALAT